MSRQLNDGSLDPGWPDFWASLQVGQDLFLSDLFNFARSLMGQDADGEVDGRAHGEVKAIYRLKDTRGESLTPLALWVEVECERQSRFLFAYQDSIELPVEVWVMERLESDPLNRRLLVDAGATHFFEGDAAAASDLRQLMFAESLSMPNPLLPAESAVMLGFASKHARERCFTGFPGETCIFRPYSFTGDAAVHGMEQPQSLTLGYLLTEHWNGSSLKTLPEAGGLITIYRGVVVADSHSNYFSLTGL